MERVDSVDVVGVVAELDARLEVWMEIDGSVDERDVDEVSKKISLVG